jgi:hypothetical protein
VIFLCADISSTVSIADVIPCGGEVVGKFVDQSNMTVRWSIPAWQE